ncbi:MAG: SoxR reducing system RseC family protein [Candidatus Ornithospirochaeta sp.]
MKKTVTVLEDTKGRIKVGCDSSLCSGCRSELFCRGRDTTFEVENPEKVPLKKGDKITVDIPEGRAAASVFLSLGLPLALFIPGYYVGKHFFSTEMMMALTGFASMGLGFLFSSVVFKIKRHYFTPTLEGKEQE